MNKRWWASQNDDWSQKGTLVLGHFHLCLISISDWYSVTNNHPFSLIPYPESSEWQSFEFENILLNLNIFLLIILKTGNDKTLKTTYFEPQKDAGALRAGEGGQWDPDENQPQERVRSKYNDQW